MSSAGYSARTELMQAKRHRWRLSTFGRWLREVGRICFIAVTALVTAISYPPHNMGFYLVCLCIFKNYLLYCYAFFSFVLYIFLNIFLCLLKKSIIFILYSQVYRKSYIKIYFLRKTSENITQYFRPLNHLFTIRRRHFSPYFSWFFFIVVPSVRTTVRPSLTYPIYFPRGEWKHCL